MKRAVIFVALVSTVIASYSLLVRASLPQIPSNTWSVTGDMVVGRAGASAVLLPDGRVLVTGGSNEGGVSASVERYSPNAGGFVATPPMENARANHSSTRLQDGRVLVVGGVGVDGHAIASAELYDPDANAWAPAAPLNHARSGHTATLLSDGRVLVAGGDDTGVADITLEVFDPFSSIFSPLDAVLSAPRTGHAAASLPDGRVLIAGGFDGTNALASVDVLDPTVMAVTAAPSLTTARAGHSATTLLDGKVLIAGGASDSSELASAEIFDPAANTFAPAGNMLASARQRHVAFLLPHNNNVLIVGGTSGGNAVATAELYTPWESNGGTFCATTVCGSGYAGPSAPNAARAWAIGAALSVPADETIRTGPADGLLLLAGGSATSSATTPTKSAELYGFATVRTDKEDYAPGTTVTISGSGWQPGEWVALLLREYPEYDEHQLVDVQADENGNIVSTEFVPDQHDVGIRFYLTAFGQQSQAQTTFRDNENLTGVLVGAQSPSTITPGNSATYVVTVSFQKVGSNQSCTADLSVTGLTSGATGALSPTSLTKSNGDADLTSTLTVSTTAAVSASTTSFTVTASGHAGTNCQGTTQTATGALAVRKVASVINVSATNGAPGGSTSLGAKLVDAVTNNGIGGETISFTINGVGSGSGATNGGGNVSASGTLPASAGTYPVVAGFSGNSTYGPATGSTTVTVGAPATTLTVGSATGTYGGTTSLSATLTQTSGGSAVSGKTVSFTLNGGSIGTGTTNSSGVATLASASLSGINAGVYATGVGASFAGDSSFAASAGNNSLTVNQKSLTVTGITATNKVYDRTTGATLNTGSTALVGVLAGDAGSVTLNTASAIGTFADKNVGTGQAVTISGLMISGSKASNYSLTQPTTTADITVKGLTVSGITASNKIYDRATTATLNTASASLVGVIGGDAVTLNAVSAAGAFADRNVGTGKTVTVSGLTIAGPDSGNYSLTQPTTTADIMVKTLTVSGVAASNKTYDGNATATLNTGSAALVGVIGADLVTLNVAGASGAFANKDVGVGKAVTVTGLTLGNTDASNYSLTQPSGVTANIGAKNLSVSGTTAVSRPYDGSTVTALDFSGAALVGVIGSDAVTIDPASAAGAFADKNVGTAKPVTVSGVALSGAGAGNYAVSQPAGLTASITAVNLNATITASDKDYDGTATATITNCSLGGVVGSEVVSCTTSNAHFASANGSVSPQVVTADVALAGADAWNYSLTSPVSTSAKINKKPASVTPAAANKVYGAADPVFTGTLTGFLVADNVSASYSRTAGDTVGAYVISAVLSPASVLGNYDITSSTAAFDISKKPASVTSAAANKVYGAADPTLTGTLSGFLAADSVTATYSRTTGETVGAYVISAVLSPASVLGNYDITSSTAAFDISKKAASVTPAAANKVYGAADPVFTGTLSGFLAADNVTASYSRTAGDTVGAYVISAVLSPASVLGNYDLTYNTAAFGINRKTASVTPDAASKVYGAADPALTGTLEGFVAGDGVAASYNRTTGETVGTYVISAVLSPASVLENYDITSNTAAFGITKRTASVTANGANKTYGTADPALSGTLSGFLAADDVTAAYSRTTGETVAGSPYTISAVLSPAGVLENYTITNNTANFMIAARALTVTAAGTSRVYDGTTDATVTLSDDRVAGDALTISYASASFTDKNKGVAKPVNVNGISLTGAAAGNYTFNTAASASADITARPITVTAAPSSKGYDAMTSSSDLPAIVSGTLVSGDTLSFTQTYDNKNVGTAKTLTPAGSVSDGNGGNNYAVTLATNTAGIITARLLTVTATGIDKVYDGTASATVNLADNRVASDALTDSYASANFLNKNVGVSKTVNVTGIAISGADAGNYTLSSTTATTMASITKRPLTVTAVTDSRTYDGTITSNKIPLISSGTSLVGGDTASLAETFDTKDVGTGKHMKPAAVVSDGNGGGNYAVALEDNPTGVIGAWSLKGFYQPVAMSAGAMVYNTIKGGSTVPLKFNVYAGVGGAEQTSTSAVQSFVLQLISCTAGIDDPLDDAFTTTGGTTLRYDSTAGQFINNWQSPKVAGKCYAVTMTAQDNSTLVAYFKTK